MKNNIDELDSLFQKGYSLYRERNYKSAFKFFEKSIKKHGEHYLKTNNFSRAEPLKITITQKDSNLDRDPDKRRELCTTW